MDSSSNYSDEENPPVSGMDVSEKSKGGKTHVTETTSYSEGDSGVTSIENNHKPIGLEVLVKDGDDDGDRGGSLLSSYFKKKDSRNEIEDKLAKREAEEDRQMVMQLQKAVQEAGQWAYGIIAVEVWALDRKTGDALYPPPGGTWMDPLAHRGQCESSTGCRACRLTNPELSSYIPPDPVAVGEGLPGILWSESGHSANATIDNTHLHWHHIPDLVDDPHRQWNRRMQWWVECGITWAAGVPFHGHNQHKGIIIYLARSGIAHDLLKSPENEDYLKAVSDQIASLYSVNSSRRLMINKRRAERNAVLRRVKIKLLAVVRFGGSIKVLTENEQKKRRESGIRDDDYNTGFSQNFVTIIFANPFVNFKNWVKWLSLTER